MSHPYIDPRRVLIPISIGTGLSILGDATLYTVLPTRTEEAGVLLASVGILLSANRWIRLPLNAPLGWLIERLPRKPVFIGSLLLGVLSTAMCALDAGYANLLAARLLWGLAWIGIWIGGTTLAFDVTDRTDRGRWIGVYQISFFLGAGAGSIAGGVLTDLLGYHGAMAVNAALQLAGALYAWATLPETREQARLRSALENAPAPLAPASAMVAPASAALAPAHANRLELASAIGLLASSRLVQEGILLASLALYMEVLFGGTAQVGSFTVGTATLTGVGLGLSTLVAAAAAPLTGSFSDRRRNRWTVAAISLFPGALGFAALRLGTPAGIALGLIGVSIAYGGSTNIATALIGDLGARSSQGRRLGGLYTVGDLASALGPTLVFWLAPTAGIAGLYWLSAGVFALAGVVSLLWGRAKTRSGRPVPVRS